MVKTIYKYVIPFRGGEVSVQIPKDAVLLKSGFQVVVTTPILCVWALVDPNAEKEERRFRIHETGHTLPDDSVAVGAAIGEFEYWETLIERDFVWHIFVSVS